MGRNNEIKSKDLCIIFNEISDLVVVCLKALSNFRSIADL